MLAHERVVHILGHTHSAHLLHDLATPLQSGAHRLVLRDARARGGCNVCKLLLKLAHVPLAALLRLHRDGKCADCPFALHALDREASKRLLQVRAELNLAFAGSRG